MQKKYLAYLALLAGWICFCYWLYAKELLPRFLSSREPETPVRIKDLKHPLAFNWDSAEPLGGEGYEEWKEEYETPDSNAGALIIKGFYFRDEKETIELDQQLAHQRVQNALKLIAIPTNKIMVQVLPKEINADVRSNPFEAIGIDRILLKDILHTAGDTIEFCFPLKDSLLLPPILINSLSGWLSDHAPYQDSITHIVGIADGSGIAESADNALDRAIFIQKKMIDKGWKEENIRLSTGQRSSSAPIRNRCVIIYFE